MIIRILNRVKSNKEQKSIGFVPISVGFIDDAHGLACIKFKFAR